MCGVVGARGGETGVYRVAEDGAYYIQSCFGGRVKGFGITQYTELNFRAIAHFRTKKRAKGGVNFSI